MRSKTGHLSLLAASAAVVMAFAAAAPAQGQGAPSPPGFECVGELLTLPSGKIDTDASSCPGPIPPNCDQSLATQPTADGYRCRDHIFATSCDARRPSEDMQAWCKEIGDRRWSACKSTSPATGQFRDWCELEEERRRQRSESLVDPELPTVTTPTPPPSIERTNQPKPEPSPVLVDVMKTLGRDPLCGRDDISRDQAYSCQFFGSVQHDFPFGNYGIDNNVEVDFWNKDFWSGEAPFKSAIQWICVQIWQILIWLLKMTLLLLSWAFARDPFAIAMGDLERALKSLHENVLGTEWTLVALAIAGLWGVWNGLIRMKFIQTIGGLAATVLLMIGALWIIYDPDSTLGFLNQQANDASLGIVSVAATGSLDHPAQRFGELQRGIFGEVAEKGWCALQQSSVEYCNADGNKDGIRNMDVWLAFAPGSPERAALYAATKGQEVPDPRSLWGQFEDWTVSHLSPISKVREEARQRRHRETAPQRVADLVDKNPSGVAIQGKDGTFTRVGLLAILAFGMLGAIALFLWIGVRLIGAAVISLLLLVLAPLMMLVAAFGEEGRARFGNWVKALVGAVLAKLIYALVLAVVLLISRILADLPLDPDQRRGEVNWTDDNFLGSWLLQAVFWWAVLIRRDRLLGWLSFDPAGERTGFSGLSQLHFGYSLLRSAGHDATRMALWAPRRGLRMGRNATRAARHNADANRRGTDEVVGSYASSELDQHADRALRTQRGDELTEAERVLAREEGLKAWLNDVGQTLRGTPDRASRAELERDRARLQSELAEHRPRARWAAGVVARGAGGDSPPSPKQRQAWVARRRDEISAWERDPGAWSLPHNRHAAGISEPDWRSAWSAHSSTGDNTALDALRARSEDALRSDRELLFRAAPPLDDLKRKEVKSERRADPIFASDLGTAQRAAREDTGNEWRGRGRMPGRRRR